jgi:hypothetical protein
VKLLKQHNHDSRKPSLHPIFFGRKERPEKASFMTQKKELKERGCVLESGFSSNKTPK